MTADDLLAADRSVGVKFARQRSWRRSAGAFLILFALASAFAAPAAAATPPGGTLSSTDAMLKWINAYRGKPEPDALPVLVRGLSEMQAFKDPESCGAYIGFIAGVLGANPERANALIEKMLTIQPADHWVLVRAIAYSGLPNWKVLLLKYADRMRTRSGMIDKYVSGKLPTLDQIAYQTTKPGMLDKVKVAFSFGVVPKEGGGARSEPRADRRALGLLSGDRLVPADRTASSGFCRSPTTRTMSTASRPAARRNSRWPAMPCATCICLPFSSARPTASRKRPPRSSTT